MFKNMKKQLKNEKGLTLIELLAVIVILAIVAAIAIPAIGNIITNSKYSTVKADAVNVLNAAQLYYLDNPEAEGDEVIVSDLGGPSGYLENPGSIPTDATISKERPHKLSTDPIEVATGKNITFSEATIDGINKDDLKGSEIPAAGHTIDE